MRWSKRNRDFEKRVRGVEDDSSHRLTVPEKAVTVKRITTEMEHGTPAKKADIEILGSAHRVYLCVLCGSENKRRLFPYAALSDWFL